ncbi:UNVERIFIED_CONTAM: hypothetical protein FKN15_024252 [Acipenser sinensis]
MLLHAAETGSKATVITAEDTDVLILCLGFVSDIPCSMYLKCGTQNHTMFLDIGKLASSVGGSVCNALIGLHAFTGCDTECFWRSWEVECPETAEKGQDLPGCPQSSVCVPANCQAPVIESLSRTV